MELSEFHCRIVTFGSAKALQIASSTLASLLPRPRSAAI